MFCTSGHHEHRDAQFGHLEHPRCNFAHVDSCCNINVINSDDVKIKTKF